MSTLAFPALMSAEVAEDPHAFYRRLRDEDPVHHDPTVDAFLVSRYADCAHAFKTPVFSTKAYEWLNEPIHGPTILQMDGSAHAKRRRILSPSLHGKGLEEFTPMLLQKASEVLASAVERSAQQLAGRMAGQREVDLIADFANRYPVAVIANMLGLPERDHDRFRGWYRSIVASLANYAQEPALLEQARTTKREIQEYFLPLIRERRETPGDDLISKLAVAEVDGDRMTDIDIKSYASLLIIAGAETTDKAFGSLFKNLLEHRDQYEAVREDRALVANAVAETLRFSPPTQINVRQTIDDVTLGETSLPEGSVLLLLIGSANRDERQFERPDEFDLHRPDLAVAHAFTAAGNYVAFGAGRHFCLGAQLAKAELEIGVNLLLDEFPEMRLADGFEPRDVGIKMRGPAELRVVLG